MRDSLIRGGVEPATEPLPESHPEAQRLRAAGGVRADELLATFNAMRDERRPYQNDFVKMMVNLVPMVADAIHGLEWFIASAPPRQSVRHLRRASDHHASAEPQLPDGRRTHHAWQREDHPAVEWARAPNGRPGDQANGGAHHD